MFLAEIALAALVGLSFGVLAGYFIRVWLSGASESDTRSPWGDAIYEHLTRLQSAQESWGTSLGVYKMDLQAMESKLTLMSNEQADFFDKTRKSEERARGHARRVEAAIGEDEDPSEADQRMLELMEQRQEEQGVPVGPPVGSREEFYKARGRPS